MPSDATDRLWTLASTCPPDAVQWLALGYRLGLHDGRDDGWNAAQLDMAIRWHAVWLATRKTLLKPTQDALAARREPDHRPCISKCGTCSRCIHSRDWWARGGPYAGTDARAEASA